MGRLRNGYRALLLDLDGTLLRRDATLSARNVEAVRAAVEAGLEVWIATGRSVCATTAYHRALGLATPACCYNGAVLYCGRTERWLSHIALDDGAATELVEFCFERDLFFIVFHDDWKYTVGTRNPGHQMFLALLDQVRTVDRASLPRRGITKVSFAGSPDDLADFDARFLRRPLYQERFDVKVIPGFEHLTFVVCDLLDGACRGKAEAIHYLEAERGIEPGSVIAVGDHLNDLPMIRAAGLGVAMANAHEDLKRAAKRVIGRNDEDGVAAFIADLIG